MMKILNMNAEINTIIQQIKSMVGKDMTDEEEMRWSLPEMMW